ncbi:hypothetical protein PAECIP112173_02747 [Paenibacillus sp. JJ-100]|uniref:hypothetical protein n=1 Tax=Paenibacillus sp. JJ-100 TaxID=2974896 RepID=UPI0022FFBB19|nr:hypothetical protein [Paenibacillus sp. JJ-100]CAI6079924.1 hypothetical protein PAECIP112173_02747 [Paenibacillus sp. JJ-100]
MRQLPDRSKRLSIHEVEQMIRDTETPEHSMSDQVVRRLNSKSVRSQRPFFTRRVGVITAALVAFCVSLTPVVAQTIERLSLQGYVNPFIKEMEENPKEKADTLFATSLSLDGDKIKNFHSGMISFDDIKDQEFKSQLQRVWDEIFPQGGKINDVVMYQYMPDQYKIEAMNENRSITFLQGNWTYASQPIRENQVPDATKDAADQVFNKLGDFKQTKRSVSRMILRPDQNPVYKFVYKTNKGTVLVDVQKNTNQITRLVAFPLSDQLDKLDDKNKYNELVEQTRSIELDKVREETVKQAKAWMNLDLADYSVSKKEYRFDTLEFTKSGSPDVTAVYTSKGKIYYIEIEL